jgi:NAD(P)-dependent dehydrogenase (short-subunit alcohol dehydrogenase family)
VDLELAGTVTLITGGTDGLGLALAHRLVAEGGSVAVCGRDETRLAAAAGGLESAGGDVLALRADVEQASEIGAFVDAAAKRWGRIDGVVHNAGRSAAGKLEDTDDAVWEGDLQLKLMGAVRLTRMALPYLRERGGSALFTLAMAAKAPGAGSAPSSVSRAAGMALMKALSKELAPEGIRVNAVLIGLIESGQWVRSSSAAGVPLPEYYRSLADGAGVPLGRIGRSDEFADLAAFLLSARASYLTGTAINLDGGLSPAVEEPIDRRQL